VQVQVALPFHPKAVAGKALLQGAAAMPFIRTSRVRLAKSVPDPVADGNFLPSTFAGSTDSRIKVKEVPRRESNSC
jgi:hypothetical protein